MATIETKASRSSSTADSDREITERGPLDLALPGGLLNRAALGWSRQPLHRSELTGPWLRRKRWDAWGINDQRWFLMIGVMNLDYANLAVVVLYDQQTGRMRAESARHVFGRGCEHSPTVTGTCQFTHPKLATEIVTTV